METKQKKQKKVVLTCALTGVLTDPEMHRVPVTPEQMATSARQAYDAGASVVHCHFRQQEAGRGRFPTWEPDICAEICDAIRQACPGVIINMSTGIVGSQIEPALQALTRVRPEMAALNAGSLNYLKLRSGGEWAWPPLLFDNPVEKIRAYVDHMRTLGILPECECFDTGIVRSVGLFVQNGMLAAPPHLSLVMGVASGMPCKASWLPLLVEEMLAGTHWQVIAIGRQEIWDAHRAAARLGGDLRSGLEDTFYLPDGSKTDNNGRLIAALARIAEQEGRSIASPDEARDILGIGNSSPRAQGANPHVAR